MAEPFPEAPITWQGRDAKGNIVDVTSEVSVVTRPPEIEASGEQRVRLLGPERVDLSTISPSGGVLAKVTSLQIPEGAIVLRCAAVATATAPDEPAFLDIVRCADLAGLASQDYYGMASYSQSAEGSWAGWFNELEPIWDDASAVDRDATFRNHAQSMLLHVPTTPYLNVGVYVSAAGDLPTQGIFDVVVLIAEPAS